MPEHVWEKSPIECSVEYSGKKNKKCEFKFYEGTRPVHVLDAKLSGVLTRSWKGKWKTRACAADELSFALTLKVFVDGEEKKRYEREYLVFADTISITAELVGVGPLVGAEMQITQQDPTGKLNAVTLDRVTGAGGKLDFDLALPSAVAIRWKRPWVIDRWEKETSRKPKAHLKRAFVAKLVFPDPTVDPDPDPRDPKTAREQVQWVNLPYDSAKPNQGSKIKIKVGAKDPDKAETGDAVFLKAVFDAKNSTRDLELKGVRPGTTVELDSTLGSDKTATFELELGPAGGDKVAVTVGGLSDCTDDDVGIVTWRMLCYDVCGPDTLTLEDAPKLGGGTGKTYPAATRTWFDAALGKGYVAYWLRGSSITAATGEPYARGMLPRAYFGASSGPAQLYVRGVGDPRPSGWGAGDARCVRVVLCDKAFAADDSKSPFTESLKIDASPYDFSVFAAHKEFVFERRMGPTGGDAIIPLTWQADVDPKTAPKTHPGLANGKPKTGSVERSWIKATNLAWLEITLPADVAAFVGPASATKCPVIVKFQVYTSFEINGSASGANQVMVLTADKPTALASTICHELGHTMGLTVYGSGPYKRKPPSGIASPKAVPKGVMYVGKGHTGSHCAEGLSAKDKKLASYQGKAGTCIMFGEGGAEPTKQTKLCDVCLGILVARRLVDICSDWSSRKAADL